MTETVKDQPFPSQLYKYRRPDLRLLSDILIGNKLWAASPTTFNDPFDCYPHVDLSGTYAEALAYIDKRIERGAINPGRVERRKLAKQIKKEGLGPIVDARGSDLWKETVNKFGVISLSEDCLNILMWSHYADNHKGVCIEFITENMPFCRASAVKYQIDRPVFRPLNLDRISFIEPTLLRKADIWRYEKEWRCFRINEGPGETSFQPSAIKSVILGAAAEHQFEHDFRELMASRVMQVPITKVRFDEKEFRLHLD